MSGGARDQDAGETLLLVLTEFAPGVVTACPDHAVVYERVRCRCRCRRRGSLSAMPGTSTGVVLDVWGPMSPLAFDIVAPGRTRPFREHGIPYRTALWRRCGLAWRRWTVWRDRPRQPLRNGAREREEPEEERSHQGGCKAGATSQCGRRVATERLDDERLGRSHSCTVRSAALLTRLHVLCRREPPLTSPERSLGDNAQSTLRDSNRGAFGSFTSHRSRFRRVPRWAQRRSCSWRTRRLRGKRWWRHRRHRRGTRRVDSRSSQPTRRTHSTTRP